MLNEKIANLILDHKEKEGIFDKYDFNFAVFYSESKKFGKIFDASAISKLYKLQDALMDLENGIKDSLFYTLKINGESSIKIFDIKETIIFLSILRDNNPSELEANLEWLQKHC